MLHHFNFKSVVNDIVFSPDGRLFAVTHAKKVQLWRTPGTSKDFAPFVLFREFPGQYDDAMCIGWSADSRYVRKCIEGSCSWHQWPMCVRVQWNVSCPNFSHLNTLVNQMALSKRPSANLTLRALLNDY